MHKPRLIGLSLICVVAISGCKSAGPVLTCPALQPLPASVMVAPQTEKKVRAELFVQPQKPTTKSEGSKKY